MTKTVTTTFCFWPACGCNIPSLDAEMLSVCMPLHRPGQVQGFFRASLAWSLLGSPGLDESEHGIKVWLLLPTVPRPHPALRPGAGSGAGKQG